jgi:hypothetical protein
LQQQRGHTGVDGGVQEHSSPMAAFEPENPVGLEWKICDQVSQDKRS